uniref:Protein kinase domain-containing protein n=1 Tax=Panagrolaimus davidi TaxID=227884 RepID=A0A914QKY0_9BILA
MASATSSTSLTYLSSSTTSTIIAERSPDDRFHRYEFLKEQRIQLLDIKVFRCKDAKTGMDVEWNEIKEREPIGFSSNKINVFEILQKLKGLRNSNIVEVYDCWEKVDIEGEKIIVFVTELIPSETLRDYIQRVETTKIDIFLSNFRCCQILNGLAFLHSQEPFILHGNLNVNNIVVTEKCKLKMNVLGFLTNGGSTSEYISPEMFKKVFNYYGKKECDEKADIYAFGMCLVEILSGERPYAECGNMPGDLFYLRNPNSIALNLFKGIKPECIKNIPEEFAEFTEIILQCLSVKSEERPSAKKLLENALFASTESIATQSNVTMEKEDENEEVIESVKQPLETRYDIPYPSSTKLAANSLVLVDPFVTNIKPCTCGATKILDANYSNAKETKKDVSLIKPICTNCQTILSFIHNFDEELTCNTCNISYEFVNKKVVIEKRKEMDDEKFQEKDEIMEDKIQEQLNSSLQTLVDLQRKFPTSAANFSDKENNSSLLTSFPSPLNAAFESKKYSDVIFLTNDSKKVFAHRCIIFSFSEIFMAFFDQSSEIPIEIDVDFSETIVNRAIQFCYGKIDGIKNYENDLIKFADNYGIKKLKDSCIKSLEDQLLTVENVCDLVVTTFQYDIHSLKEKCKTFIALNKNEIGAEKLAKLPMDFIVSAFLSL